VINTSVCPWFNLGQSSLTVRTNKTYVGDQWWCNFSKLSGALWLNYTYSTIVPQQFRYIACTTIAPYMGVGWVVRYIVPELPGVVGYNWRGYPHQLGVTLSNPHQNGGSTFCLAGLYMSDWLFNAQFTPIPYRKDVRPFQALLYYSMYTCAILFYFSPSFSPHCSWCHYCYLRAKKLLFWSGIRRLVLLYSYLHFHQPYFPP